MNINWRRVLIIGAVLGVVAFIITSPTEAGAAVQSAVGWLKDGAQAIVTFVQGVFS